MKPMLAAPVKDLTNLHYPVFTSPKYDGIRAIVLNGVVLSRSLKPIPNAWVQQLFGRKELNGLDGELIVGSSTAPDVFNATSSGVMSRTGTPDVRFFVFDSVLAPDNPFNERFQAVRMQVAKYTERTNTRVWLVDHTICYDVSDVEQQEIFVLSEGYEGLMIRALHGPYKFGRSSLKEGYLLKLKRFEDGEAKILGMTELMHNANEVQVNALGENERSHKKAGMVGKGLMGSLLVEDLKTGVQFEIGTGFTATQRGWFWNYWKSGAGGVLKGTIIKYKFQAVGVKDKPRFPVYLGIRDRKDIS